MKKLEWGVQKLVIQAPMVQYLLWCDDEYTLSLSPLPP